MRATRIVAGAIACASLLGVVRARAQAPAAAAPPGRPRLDGARIAGLRTLGPPVPSPQRLYRLLGLVPGGVYDSLRVERSRREVLQLGWLADLQVYTTPAGSDSLLVVVLVQRAPSTRLEPLLAWLPDEKLVMGGTLRVSGNAGRGERLKLRAAGGGQELMQVEWMEPRPFVGAPLTLRVHADVVEEIAAAEDNLTFARVVVGAAVGVRLGGVVLELAGSAWQVASEPAGLLSTGARDELSRGTVALVWGRPPERFDWSYLHGSLRLGATTGDAETQEFTAGLELGRKFLGRSVLAAGFVYNDVRGTRPRYLRHHLGGGPSLRGHRYGVANGDASTWGGVELRVPINFWSPASFRRAPLPLTIHLFADAGSAWGASALGAETEAAARGDARLRWSAGAGIGCFVRRSYALRGDFGRDDEGVWRAQFATSLPF